MILLDTCAVLWSRLSPNVLKPRARTAISSAERERAIYLCSITAWEIATLVRKNRMELETSATVFIQRIFRHAGVCEIPVDREIAGTAGLLEGAFNGDPADRLIVATAIVRGIPLMTRDRRILEYAQTSHTFRAVAC